MVRRLLVLLVLSVMMIGLGTSVSAASDTENVKALELIEKTNREIDKEIEKAVKKADKLQADYIKDVKVIEEGKEVIKLKDEKEKLSSELETHKHDAKKIAKLEEDMLKIEEKLAKETAKIEKKISEIEADIQEITISLTLAEDKDSKKLHDKLEKLTKKLNKRIEKAEEKTEKYTKDLEKVITDNYNKTLEMSAETIAKVAEVGIIAECTWKLVRFADQWVWIDPVRVVKL
ncbi:hypothetical protein [Lederbergia citrea]|uniref:hypothetical protein n=1 Tax=Lederbergia citrea TaxID=2833581 RepID=UPI001BC8F554|nr:hypothetical protein [Lederbergia citrea]MBS4206261.1 hypothetical protein [Lederbergia citrea]